MEVSHLGSNLNSDTYLQFQYQLAEDQKKDENKESQSGNDLSSNLLQKVERQNDIKTETYTKFVAYTGSIKAQVINSNTGAGIRGATVQAYQNGATAGDAVTTDADGYAVLSGLAVGCYTVHVSYAGEAYSADSGSITVTKDIVSSVSVGLAVSGGSANVTVTNGSGKALSGVTVTATYGSNPTVASANQSIIDRVLGVKTVYAAQASFSLSATTNANGVAGFTNLPPGTYTFKAVAHGASMTSEPVTVSSGALAIELIMIPTSGGNIRAAVKDSSGAVLSGATVTVSSNAGTAATGVTDSTGVAHITGIAAGSYTVSAALANYTAGNPATVTVSDGNTASANLTLTIQTGNADITVNDGANPVSDATVSVTVNGTLQTAETNASGVASFTGLPVGAYTFTASKNGYTGASVNNVSITNGGTATGTISVTLQTGNADITVNDGANPVSDATVSVTVNGTLQTAETNASGVASFTNLPVGSYTFTASGNGYTGASVNNVSVTNGGTATGTISMTLQTGNANITVNDGFYPVSDATVSVTVNGTPLTAEANIYGVASFTGLPVGTYTFTASKNGYTGASVNNVSVTNGGTAIGTISVIRQTGNANITVNDGTNPVGGVPVSVEGPGLPTRTDTTDGPNYASFGVASFLDLPVGTYTFTAYKDGYDQGAVYNVSITSGGLATATITLKQLVGSVNVILGGTMSASPYTVSVTDSAGGTHKGSVSSGSTTTTISGVPVGNCTVTVTPPSGYTATASPNSFTLTSGGQAAVTITSNQISDVTVPVTFSDGNPTNETPSFFVDGSNTAYPDVTLNGGAYTLRGLSTNAQHTIKVSAPFYSSSTDTMPLTVFPDKSTVTVPNPVTLTAQAQSVNLHITEIHDFTVVAPLSFTLQNMSTDVVTSGTISSSGVINVSVPAGSYRLHVLDSFGGYSTNDITITGTDDFTVSTRLTFIDSLVLDNSNVTDFTIYVGTDPNGYDAPPTHTWVNKISVVKYIDLSTTGQVSMYSNALKKTITATFSPRWFDNSLYILSTPGYN